ncbi:MAG: 30S ribosomal protein S12 methylthiotransferase RimO [Clostridiales bacterium]|nr:30S ribosomal protein S12 methylthiotransferase RimO [Clostridiales bacterium]
MVPKSDNTVVKRQYNCSVISLGCDKNRVDTERMMYNLNQVGYSFVEHLSDAHLIIVNTCAFITSAQKESIDTILQVANYKISGVCQKLIVTGCMSQKYAVSTLYNDLPEVDAFLGVGAYDRIGSIVDKLYKGDRVIDVEDTKIESTERFVTTPQHYAYLKISEGCNFKCSFCTIPSIRGKLKSRDVNSLIEETKSLVDKGAKEIILVAQDLTSFGFDLGNVRLNDLVEHLGQIEGVEWIRLMYCYPDLVTDNIIDLIAHHSKVTKYIDMPLQHINTRILQLMGRHQTKDKTISLIKKIREANSDIAIRSTFITGFPSESDAEHEELIEFLKTQKLDNVGFFAYSREQGTPSYDFKHQITKKVKNNRLKELGQAQLQVARQKNQSLIGKSVTVLYEGIDYDKQMLYGRTQQNAPNIDSLVYFNAKNCDIGNFYQVVINGVSDYDLIGEIIS